MIPTTNSILTAELNEKSMPSQNYRMDIPEKTICGYCDGLEAMKQVIFKILSTERYRHIIYSWNYGVELEDLFGEQPSYICPELERRITEALIQDDRIKSVDSFSFALKRKSILVSFTVHTIFGDVDAEKVVGY